MLMRMSKQHSFHVAQEKIEKKGMLAIPSKRDQKQEIIGSSKKKREEKKFKVDDDDDAFEEEKNNKNDEEKKATDVNSSPQDGKIFTNSPVLRGYMSDSSIKKFDNKPRAS
jgi:hypothetical protein